MSTAHWVKLWRSQLENHLPSPPRCARCSLSAPFSWHHGFLALRRESPNQHHKTHVGTAFLHFLSSCQESTTSWASRCAWEQQLRDEEQPMATGAGSGAAEVACDNANRSFWATCFLFTFSKSFQSMWRSFSRTYYFTKYGWIFTEMPNHVFLTQRIPSSCLIWSLCFVKCKSKWSQPFHFKIFLNLPWQFPTL